MDYRVLEEATKETSIHLGDAKGVLVAHTSRGSECVRCCGAYDNLEIFSEIIFKRSIGGGRGEEGWLRERKP